MFNPWLKMADTYHQFVSEFARLFKKAKQIPSGGSINTSSVAVYVGYNSGDNGTLRITGGSVSNISGTASGSGPRSRRLRAM